MNDVDYLKKALVLAEKSTEPVGCAALIVVDDNILAEEVNSQDIDNIAVNHAEIKSIVAANKKTGQKKLLGATVYCSCEPCAMCLAALSYAKVERIVFNKKMKDLFPDDPQSKLDSLTFVNGLNYQPVLEQLDL